MFTLQIRVVSFAAVCLLVSITVAQDENAAVREWKDSTGQFSIKAKLVEVEQDNIRLQKLDGTTISVAKSKLSRADQDFIADLAIGKVADAPEPKVDPDAIVTTPDVIQQDVKDDRKAAVAKYSGTTIQMTGTVESFVIGDDGTGISAYVVLAAEADADKRVSSRVAKPWEIVSVGDRATIVGKGDFRIGAPRLVDASITSSEGNPMMKLTATDLVKSFAQDPDTTIEKYHRQVCVITGKVVEVRMGEGVDFQRILLMGDGEIPLHIGVDETYGSQLHFGKVEVGDDLSVLGLLQIQKVGTFPVGVSVHYVYNIGLME